MKYCKWKQVSLFLTYLYQFMMHTQENMICCELVIFN